MRPDSDDYRSIFLNDIALMDVRAPVEFHKGAFPTALNIPLLDDQQREQIGIQYKQAGEEEAIELGLKLATAEIRQQRLQDWSKFCRVNPQGYLYCFRGGLRSRTTQQWLREQGLEYPLIRGGYKAMRRFLIDDLQTSVEQMSLVIVSGLTGSGKTRVLRKISRQIDFEGIANHRGSAFGRDASDQQPGTIDWENQVAIEFLKLRDKNPAQPVFVEDEGRRIGRVSIPDNLFEKMRTAPRAILTVETAERIQLITEDYILNAWPEYQARFGETAASAFDHYVLDNLARIQKRLGGQAYKLVRRCFESALQVFHQTGETDEFNEGISILLQQYYDPMYRYQLKEKQVDVLFQGPEPEFLEWSETYISDAGKQVIEDKEVK